MDVFPDVQWICCSEIHWELREKKKCKLKQKTNTVVINARPFALR